MEGGKWRNGCFISKGTDWPLGPLFSVFSYGKYLYCLFQVIVLSVGTNNYGDTAKQIAEGIQTICTVLRNKQPQAYIILLVI